MPDAGETITNLGDLPKDTTVEWKTEPDTTKPGIVTGVVVVTYPDGSSEDVDVTVTVEPKPVVVKDADKYTPKPGTITVVVGEQPDAGDLIVNLGDLPGGTTVDWKTPIDTTKPGIVTGTIVVNYPDGSSEAVKVSITVRQEPDYTDTSGNGTVVIVNVGGKPTDTTTVEITDGDATATIDPKTGDISVVVGDGAVPGDIINVTVKDGDKVIDEFQVTVTAGPNWHDTRVDAGDEVKIPNVGGDITGELTVTVNGGDAKGTATIDPTTGELVFVPGPAIANGGAAIIIVTDANGKVIDTVAVVVDKKNVAGHAELISDGTRGGTITFTPAENIDAGSLRVVSGPGKAVLNGNGTISILPNRNAKPGSAIVVDIIGKDGNPAGTITVRVPDDYKGAGTITVQPGANVDPSKPGAGSLVVDPDGNVTGGSMTIDNGKPGQPGSTSVVTVTGGDSIKAGGIQILDKDGNPLRDAAGNIVIAKDNGDGTFSIDFGGATPGIYTVVIVDKWDNTFTSDVAVDQYQGGDTPAPTTTAPVNNGSSSGNAGEGSSDAQKKCIAAGVGTSLLPLLLLAPLALASQVRVPGMEQVAGRVSGEIARINDEIQRGLGIANDNVRRSIEEFNGLLGGVRIDAGQAGPIIGGILGAATLLALGLGGYEACMAANGEPGLSSEGSSKDEAAAIKTAAPTPTATA